MAEWIKVDGTRETVKAKGRYFSLQELQDRVGGYIERIPIVQGQSIGNISVEEGQCMLVNEEGISKELKLNPEASRIAGQTILGNVLILNDNEWD